MYNWRAVGTQQRWVEFAFLMPGTAALLAQQDKGQAMWQGHLLQQKLLIFPDIEICVKPPADSDLAPTLAGQCALEWPFWIEPVILPGQVQET